MITGYARWRARSAAVKAGAEEYLAKPFTDEELLAAVRALLDKLHVAPAGAGAAGGRRRVSPRADRRVAGDAGRSSARGQGGAPRRPPC